MSIHGKLKTTRFKIFDKFRSLKTTGLLVCTDVMARGIDIADIDWVFQFDAPSSASDFVHRCGRTARIGNRGTALALLLPNEEPYVHFIDINQKVLNAKNTFFFFNLGCFIVEQPMADKVGFLLIHQLQFLSN